MFRSTDMAVSGLKLSLSNVSAGCGIFGKLSGATAQYRRAPLPIFALDLVCRR